MDKLLYASTATDRLRSKLLEERSRTPEDSSTFSDYSAWVGRVAVVSLILIYAALWTIARPYRGLVHDARLYALQTLSKVEPEIFGGDLFLRFGSQDNFSVFSALNAVLVTALGLEQATATLTFALSVAWLALGFLIARELNGARLGLLSLGALIVVPGWYGAYEVFQINEMFLSARLPAEVLAMAALLVYLLRLRWLGLALGVLSALVHPLMAIPMIGLLLLIALRELRGPGSTPAVVILVVLGATVATLLVPSESMALHSEWLAVLKTRNPFLFVGNWRFLDWQNHALVLLTLILSARALADPRARQVALCAAWVGASGVVLAAIAAALPDYPTLLRVQPWRWMWVSNLLAIILAPALLLSLWGRAVGTSERTAATLILSAWLLGSSGGGILATAAAVTCFAGSRLSQQSATLIAKGARVTLAAVVLSALVAAFQFAAFPNDTNRDPIWIQRIVNFFGPTSMSLMTVAAFWALVTTRQNRCVVAALAVASVFMLASLGPRSVRDWTAVEYSQVHHQSFEKWRSVIPEDAEVLWPGYTIATWLLLERRSYFSSDQLAGLLYSPRMTEEMGRRAAALSPLARPGWWTRSDGSKEAKPKPLSVGILLAVCKRGGPDFIVSENDVGGAVSQVRRPGREIDLYLYDCRNWRLDQLESL